MFPILNHRLGHYLLLMAVAGILFFPNLGVPSLWDVDEGHNAEAAREMLESGNWLVPTFNFQLRDHKPPLLYWLQLAAYHFFGINEFAARLPSALAALVAVIITYELGRRMFSVRAGLLAGLILASSAMFAASAHFANPDALLDALSLLTLFLFWQSFSRNDRGWIIPASVCMGLAVLTKGPVGLLLPMAVIGLFLFWTGRLHLLVNGRCFWGACVFGLVALPWYIWIAAETRGEFLRGFFLTHNVGRFLSSMENHRGPIYYYLIALGLGFVPWSPFLPAAFWYGLKRPRIEDRGSRIEEERTGGSRFSILDPRSSILFLLCWIAVYLLFFSLAGTKLPNYILPVYPAVAIITAWFFDNWIRGSIQVPAWMAQVSLGGVALVGIAVGFGLFVAGGVVDLPVLRGPRLPGLEVWAGLGAVPVLGAVLASWLAIRNRYPEMLGSLLITAVIFTGPLAAWATIHVDAFKASRPLVLETHACQTDRDIRVGCYQFYQPSLVFYCRREVKVLNDDDQALEFIQSSLPVYLFVPAKVWQALEGKVKGPHYLLADHYDLYKGYQVVVVTNVN